MVKIGEDRTERVDYRPAKIVVKVFVQPKYACTKKHGGVKQAETPPGPVPGGRFDFGLVAQVVTSKTCDHLPLYRQQDVLARAGNRTEPLDLVRDHGQCGLPAGTVGRAAQAAVAGQRLVGGRRHAGAAARSGASRGRAAGPLLAVPRAGHSALQRVRLPREPQPRWTAEVSGRLSGLGEGRCLWCGRRRVPGQRADPRQLLPGPCAAASSTRPNRRIRGWRPKALGFFQQLLRPRRSGSGTWPQVRQALRQAEAVPLLAKLRVWADEQATQVPPKLKLGEALGYLRNQWEPLTNYVHDGRLPIDNNAVERDLRALTIGRKNWLFIGSHEAGPRAAILYTVVASAARHDLGRLGLSARRAGAAGPPARTTWPALLPDAWAAAHPAPSAPIAPMNAKPSPPPNAPAATPPRPRTGSSQAPLKFRDPWRERALTKEVPFVLSALWAVQRISQCAAQCVACTRRNADCS